MFSKKNLRKAGLATFLFAGTLVLIYFFYPGLSRNPEEPAEPEMPSNVRNSKVQLALLLDTSGSMSGLIDQARLQLWDIVNKLSEMKKDGVQPDLEIALYEYGNDNLSEESGWVRQISPFTNDLDVVSQELFSLTTAGGDEFCGVVIQTAMSELEWSKDKGDLKMIYIAGNEPFSQGFTDHIGACRNAALNDVTVNTIFCGDHDLGINTEWLAGAKAGKGEYMNIDHNAEVQFIEAPQDEEIARLNREMNETYIWIGRAGNKKEELMKSQDQFAYDKSSSMNSSRVQSKLDTNYKKSLQKIELLEATSSGDFDYEELNDSDLPAAYRGLSEGEFKLKIEEQSAKRKSIEKKLKELISERNQYIASQDKGEDNTLKSALEESVEKNARKKEFNFK